MGVSLLEIIFVGERSRLKESLCPSGLDTEVRGGTDERLELSKCEVLRGVPLREERGCVFGAMGGGGAIEGRPLTLGRDLTLEIDVRAVVLGVDVRGDE